MISSPCLVSVLFLSREDSYVGYPYNTLIFFVTTLAVPTTITAKLNWSVNSKACGTSMYFMYIVVQVNLLTYLQYILVECNCVVKYDLCTRCYKLADTLSNIGKYGSTSYIGMDRKKNGGQ